MQRDCFRWPPLKISVRHSKTLTRFEHRSLAPGRNIVNISGMVLGITFIYQNAHVHLYGEERLVYFCFVFFYYRLSWNVENYIYNHLRHLTAKLLTNVRHPPSPSKEFSLVWTAVISYSNWYFVTSFSVSKPLSIRSRPQESALIDDVIIQVYITTYNW